MGKIGLVGHWRGCERKRWEQARGGVEHAILPIVGAWELIQYAFPFVVATTLKWNIPPPVNVKFHHWQGRTGGPLAWM